MLKRFELHNHTTESDASITCAELVDLMARDRVDAFALTDHNTISGHRIVKKILEEKKPPVQCVYGMEYTTYYGHILCLNLRRYVPWDSIDRNCPEKLFRACREAGALAGIAHPFSYGAPFARGCRFEMTVTDFSQVDFIEVFNNSEPLHEVNERGLNGWQALVLRGEKLAATSGMDLHGARDMSMNFATYVEGEPNGDPALELERAIRSQQTWLSAALVARCRRRRAVLAGGRPQAGLRAERFLSALADRCERGAHLRHHRRGARAVRRRARRRAGDHPQALRRKPANRRPRLPRARDPAVTQIPANMKAARRRAARRAAGTGGSSRP